MFSVPHERLSVSLTDGTVISHHLMAVFELGFHLRITHIELSTLRLVELRNKFHWMSGAEQELRYCLPLYFPDSGVRWPSAEKRSHRGVMTPLRAAFRVQCSSFAEALYFWKHGLNQARRCKYGEVLERSVLSYMSLFPLVDCDYTAAQLHDCDAVFCVGRGPS